MTPIGTVGPSPSGRDQPKPSLKTIRLRCPGATTHFTDIRIGGQQHADETCGPEETIELAGQAIECSLTATRRPGSEGFVVEFGDSATSTAHGSQVGGWRNEYLGLIRSETAMTAIGSTASSTARSTDGGCDSTRPGSGCG